MSALLKSDRQARRIRRFVALHLVAVASVYGLALVVGGGWAPSPFPPDARFAARAEATLLGGAPGPAPAWHGMPAVRSEAAQQHDVAPPWSFDERGRALVREP